MISKFKGLLASALLTGGLSLVGTQADATTFIRPLFSGCLCQLVDLPGGGDLIVSHPRSGTFSFLEGYKIDKVSLIFDGNPGGFFGGYLSRGSVRTDFGYYELGGSDPLKTLEGTETSTSSYYHNGFDRFISPMGTGDWSYFVGQTSETSEVFSKVTLVVEASAVPEASTWAMMLVGFGLVGGALRHRRRDTKVSYATA